MTPSKNTCPVCVSCGRPAPRKAAACPYCGEEVLRPVAWRFARRFAFGGLALALLGLLLAHGGDLPGRLCEAWGRLEGSPAAKLLAALSLGLAVTPGHPSPLPHASRDRLVAGLSALALGLLSFHAPAPAAWAGGGLALASFAGLFATRAIEPWRLAPALLLPLAWLV
ncbi:MAG: hypothetical protein ACOX5G_02405 [Kiritimatiellia bacterium]|jgi:hypothetical protein